MSEQYEIKYLLRETNIDNLHIVEVKCLDLPEDAPREKRYHWLWIEKGVACPLTYVDSYKRDNVQGRKFVEGTLEFSIIAAGFVCSNHKGRSMYRLSTTHVGKEITDTIETFLKEQDAK